MASGKTKYLGVVPNLAQPSNSKLFDFPPSLVISLGQYCPHLNDVDDFANHILSAARFAMQDLLNARASLEKQDIAAEREDLEKSLRSIYDKLRSISPELDEQFDDDADPLGCADAISKMVNDVERAKPKIDARPPKQKIAQAQHQIMVEMAVRVLRAGLPFGLKPAATSDSARGKASDAVRVLKAMGDSMGVVWEYEAWRKVICEAKRQAPDLKYELLPVSWTPS